MAVQVVEFASLFNDEIARFFDVLSKAFLILFTKIPPFSLSFQTNLTTIISYFLSNCVEEITIFFYIFFLCFGYTRNKFGVCNGLKMLA